MKHRSIIIILILLSLLSYWFYNNFEYVSEVIETGFQGKARDNPLLAAEKLLQRMGARVKNTQSFSLLEKQDILILINPSLTEVEEQQLDVWMQSGGHLMITSNDLSNLNITHHTHNRHLIPPYKTIPIIWNNKSLTVAFHSDYSIERKHYFSIIKNIKSQYGTHFLSFESGAGLISVFSDMDFMTNHHIDTYDHAYFLWALVEETKGTIWLGTPTNVINTVPPSLWQTLWMVILSASLLVLFWVWHVSRRFGSVFPPPSRHHRRLLEHVEASGHFLWRHKNAHILLDSARQTLLTHIAFAYPEWNGLSPSELNQALSQITDIKVNDIDTALHIQHTSQHAYTFTHHIKILSKIRAKL